MCLTVLKKFADAGDTMPTSFELRGQCLVFAAYIRTVKWHFSVRIEALELANRFDSIARRGL
jgi:hypothetical protein